MKNATGKAIQNMNLFMIMCLFVFSSGLEMSFRTCRFGVVISVGSLVCLFVWLVWFPLVKRDSGTLGT